MKWLQSSDKDLIFIDTVLNYLNTNINKDVDFKDIVNNLEIKKVRIHFENNPPLIFNYINEYDVQNNYYLATCLNYLIEEDYITCPTRNNFKITYEGILKLKTNTFKEEGFQSKWGKPKEFYIFILAILSFITTILSLVL